jgi:hypothetical protein
VAVCSQGTLAQQAQNQRLAATAQPTQLLLPREPQQHRLLTCHRQEQHHEQQLPVRHQLQEQEPTRAMLLLCTPIRTSSRTPQERLQLCLCVLKPPLELVSLQHVVQQTRMLMLQQQQQLAVCLQQM